MTDTWDYDAFGNLLSRTGTTPNNYLFTAEQWDPDLGLYYLRARYHNPATGRFWSMDSFEGFGSDPTSLHKYAFCANNPVNAWDPSGNFTLAETTFSMGLWSIARGIFDATIGGLTGALAGGYDSILHGRVDNDQIAQAMTAGFKEGAIAGGFFGIVGQFGRVGQCGAALVGMSYSGMGYLASYQSFINGNYSASAFEGAMASFGTVASVAGLTTALTSEFSAGRVVVTPNGYRNAVWAMGSKQRGLTIEKAWGGNLPAGFKTYDRWHPQSGTATSIKSLDLDGTSYRTADSVFEGCSKYIDDIIDFDEYEKMGVKLEDNDIKTKVLRVAIPRFPSTAQLEGMQRLVDYGKLNKIQVIFGVY